MPPIYDLDKIKFATDRPTFERAVELYERGKVTHVQKDFRGYSATVLGGNPYNVSVSDKQFDRGICDCYMGQKDYLCKHMVALAIYAVLGGKLLKKEDKESVSGPKCSGRLGELSEIELDGTKKLISEAMRYIKPYNGPSKIWFAYQSSLSEGCNRLSAIVSKLPVSRQTADLLVKTLLRLDTRLCQGGVDDSDGTVGGFIEEVVGMLKEYAKTDSACLGAFRSLEGKETCFGWEEPLWQMVDNINGKK